MEIINISSQLIAESNCILPIYKYSTIRGSIGHALKKVICIKYKTDCVNCSVINHCPYVSIFDSTITQNEFLPFVSYCSNTQKSFPAGSGFDVQLILMGEAMKYTSYLLLALNELCTNGLGVNRREFSLKKTDTKTKKLEFKQFDSGKYKVEILSPLRAKQGSRLVKEISIEKILSLSINRIQALYNANQTEVPRELSYSFLLQEISRSTKWIDVDRYSNRQNTKMSLGGFIGNICYEDKTGSAASLIEFVSNIHIGKQTTFGYGKIIQERI